jgi:S1-C subfamily serine protease
VNILDVLLLLLALGYAIAGYQRGFVVGVASTVGLLLGGYIGIEVAPKVLDRFKPGLGVSLAALVIVLLAAFVGQTFGGLVGRRIRDAVTWQPARLLDALGGSVLSAGAVLLIAWVLGVAVSGLQLRPLNREIQTSVVLRTVDSVLPGGANQVLSTFNSLVDFSRFPRYLEPFAIERIKPVRPPQHGIGRDPAVHSDRASVVKVLGEAPSCGRNLEGSGFVYAPGLVMTNAHVVAGVTHVVVQRGSSQFHAAVVYYDPNVDVAVLAAPALRAPELHFGKPAHTGQPAAVLGYPGNGPYDVEPARVRDSQTLRSPNIYGDGSVARQTYSVYAQVRHGNSGGPLVNRRGRVIGVVFAASLTDSKTGYALTASQVSAAAARGRSSTSSVPTGSCAP